MPAARLAELLHTSTGNRRVVLRISKQQGMTRTWHVNATVSGCGMAQVTCAVNVGSLQRRGGQIKQALRSRWSDGGYLPHSRLGRSSRVVGAGFIPPTGKSASRTSALAKLSATESGCSAQGGIPRNVCLWSRLGPWQGAAWVVRSTRFPRRVRICRLAGNDPASLPNVGMEDCKDI